MRRRTFLVGGLLVANGAALGLWRWLRRSVPSLPEHAQELAPASAPKRLLAPESEILLLAVADVVVPADGDAPAASGIDFVPALERWVRTSPERERIYTAWWPVFERALRARVPLRSGRPEPEALEQALDTWHREYRVAGASIPARFFEQLRRDILRVYYASPAGWASVGYRGPVHRSHPLEGRGVLPV